MTEFLAKVLAVLQEQKRNEYVLKERLAEAEERLGRHYREMMVCKDAADKIAVYATKVCAAAERAANEEDSEEF